MLKRLFLLTLCFFLLSCSDTSSWTIKVTDYNNPTQTPIIIRKGQYTKLKISLIENSLSENSYPQNDKIELQGEGSKKFSFFLSQKNFEINTYKSIEYEAYIGISCDYTITEEYIFNLTGIKNIFTPENFTIHVKDEIITYDLFKETITVLTNSENFYILKDELYNVNPIYVSINTDENSFNGKIIPPFNERRKIETNNTNNLKLIEYKINNISEGELSVIINPNNKCFDIGKTFNINVKHGDFPIIHTLAFQNKIENSFELKHSNNSLYISFICPSKYIMITCVLYEKTNIVIDEKILLNTRREKEEWRYSYYFAEKDNESIIMVFNDLSKKSTYNLVCAFKSSDITLSIQYYLRKQDLTFPKEKDVNVQCCSWFFSNEDSKKCQKDAYNFRDAILPYFQNKMMSSHGEYQNKGCVSGVVEKLYENPNEIKIQFRALSHGKCPSNYPHFLQDNLKICLMILSKVLLYHLILKLS